jgi:hypothetical protein
VACGVVAFGVGGMGGGGVDEETGKIEVFCENMFQYRTHALKGMKLV